NVTVGRFVVEHAGAGGEDLLLNTRDFSIQVSTDGTNFTTVATIYDNIQSITTHDIKPTTARYVRLNIETPAQTDESKANIYELAVFAPVVPTPPAPRVLAAQPTALIADKTRAIRPHAAAPANV